ncbi:hypothetical protein [Desulfomarina sp.]
MNNEYITKIFEGGYSGNPLNEILFLASIISPGVDNALIRDMDRDLSSFFSGKHPLFKKNTLKYHDLRHSKMVVLATIRLFHGLYCNNTPVHNDTLTKGLLSAYFHDTGMLLQEGEDAQSGAEYMANHEQRSVHFLEQYGELKNLDRKIVDDCAAIIQYTDLSADPATFFRHPEEIMLAGRVVGTADILAQMADRYYLEALPILYREIKKGGTSRFVSALDLMQHTVTFYHNIALKRLRITFADTSRSMQVHFRERYSIDRNLYTDYIDKNINYLNKILQYCETDTGCIDQYLRRKPPVI